MLRHLFKLIWNKKKQNFLFLAEILISFMVLFAVFSFSVYYYQNFKKPMGFSYDRVWRISYNNSQETKNPDSLTLFYEGLKRSMKSLPQVEEVSFSGSNVPFSDSFSSTNLTFKGKTYDRINFYSADTSYKEVWKMKIIEGRWFSKEDELGKYKATVIDESLKEVMFGKESAIGKIMGDGDAKDSKNDRKIIGVVQDTKVAGDYHLAGKSFYSKLDTSAYRWIGTITMRVTPDADAAFESKLYKLLANRMKKSNIEIAHSDNMRRKKNSETLIPLIIFMIIAGFLIINVALGLFGVLWYSINKRKGEIGLRRAIGATGRSVSSQLVYESMLLATLSLVVGCFFAVQFPLLNVYNLAASVYLVAMLLAVVFIYLLVFLCSLYPGKQAAAIQPAIALHEE